MQFTQMLVRELRRQILMEMKLILQLILKSGQTVEIITSRLVKPKPNWLDMVITSKAKTAIKAQLRESSKTELSKLGKHLISDALKYQKVRHF